MPMIAAWLDKDFVTAFLFGAVLAFLVHSSVATVLLIAALAGKGRTGVDASVSMLLGANLGAGFIAVWLTRSMAVRGRRLPVGNLLFRGAGASCSAGGTAFRRTAALIIWARIPGFTWSTYTQPSTWRLP